ncbi:hypothetical protein [Pseudomonas aeruginosa]|uniref:hypothetical protein n=1 Tax=Pseudomonas aeruginosa TaxID=287 RepID=UPI001CA5F26C|nr:hypothetical protein [Pseudomonas aeruginosa]MBW6070368.1 hypothetical protein [Pseudomonas aeruginosa]
MKNVIATAFAGLIAITGIMFNTAMAEIKIGKKDAQLTVQSCAMVETITKQAVFRMSEGHSADDVGVLMLNNSAKLKDELDTNNWIALTFVFNSLNKINNDLNSKEIHDYIRSQGYNVTTPNLAAFISGYYGNYCMKHIGEKFTHMVIVELI